MTTDLAVIEQPAAIEQLATIRALLIPAAANKDARSRIGKFCAWLIAAHGNRFEPDLSKYRDHLLGSGLNAATVQAHLATIRSQYARLLRNNDTRDKLYALTETTLETPADRKAFVDEAIERLRNSIDAKNSSVTVTKVQDRADSSEVRLTRAQAEQLLAAPGVKPLEALRDTALLALLLCTGIREEEAINVEVKDLRQRLGGELALHVRHGKGDKERLIPYGDLSWVLAVLDKWLAAANITEGKVFRSFWHGGRVIRGDLSLRAVENIVGKYPVMGSDGTLLHVKPHDLRRTYAARLYDAGKDILSISQNLGHRSIETTKRYIGVQSADKRRAALIYSFNLSTLEQVE